MMKKITLFCSSNFNAYVLHKTHLLLILLLVNSICWAQLTVFDNVTTTPRSLYESDGKLYTRLNSEIRVWDNLPQNTDISVVNSSTGSADGFIVENNILYYTDQSMNNVVKWDLNNSTQTFLGNAHSAGINPDYITIVNGTIFTTADYNLNGSSLKVLLVYVPSSDSFFTANGLGNGGEITGMKADGTTIYILKKSGLLLSVDASNISFQVTILNNNLGADSFGLEIVNDLVYYTDQNSGSLKTVSKSVTNDNPQTVVTGLNSPTDVKKVGNTFYISDKTSNRIYAYNLPPCTVNITDNNLKNALLAHGTTITGTNVSVIDTNADGEIQCTEASNYTGKLNLNNQSINNLTGLEAFTNITNLDISNNLFTSIDISALSALVEFKADFILASNIDFSNLNNLEVVKIEGGQLTTVTFASNSKLRVLDLQDNQQLQSIDLMSLTQLEELKLRNNKLSTLDVTKNTLLKRIDAPFNNISILDLTQNTALEVLIFYNNNLSNIDVSQNTALESLIVSNNNLGNINLSQNTVLTVLNIGNNNLSSIDLSTNGSLDTFFTTGNPNLTNLDLSNNQNLFRVRIDNSAITSLDLSNNSGLDQVEIFSNPSLTSLNVANGSNAAINYADFTNNTALSCIQIDTGFTPPTSSWAKDTSASYSNNCAVLYVIDYNTGNFKLYPNPVSNILNIDSNKQIESLELYTLLGKKLLVTNNKNNINLSNLSAGVYFIKIIDESDNAKMHKIIKN